MGLNQNFYLQPEHENQNNSHTHTHTHTHTRLAATVRCQSHD